MYETKYVEGLGHGGTQDFFKNLTSVRLDSKNFNTKCGIGLCIVNKGQTEN